MQVFDLESVKARPREVGGPVSKSRAWTYLKSSDKTMLELAEKGLSHRLIGQALELNPGTVSRRLMLIKTRLTSPLSRLALDPTSPLPLDCRQSVVLHAVAGMSLREVARTRRVPLSGVTDHVRYAQGVAKGLSSRR